MIALYQEGELRAQASNPYAKKFKTKDPDQHKVSSSFVFNFK